MNCATKYTAELPTGPSVLTTVPSQFVPIHHNIIYTHLSAEPSWRSPQKASLSHLFGLGKADGVVAQVVDAVPPAQESITQNGQRTNRLREVHAHQSADARTLNLEDVVVGSDGEVVASQGEGEVGQVGALVALNGVLAVP